MNVKEDKISLIEMNRANFAVYNKDVGVEDEDEDEDVPKDYKDEEDLTESKMKISQTQNGNIAVDQNNNKLKIYSKKESGDNDTDDDDDTEDFKYEKLKLGDKKNADLKKSNGKKSQKIKTKHKSPTGPTAAGTSVESTTKTSIVMSTTTFGTTASFMPSSSTTSSFMPSSSSTSSTMTTSTTTTSTTTTTSKTITTTTTTTSAATTTITTTPTTATTSKPEAVDRGLKSKLKIEMNGEGRKKTKKNEKVKKKKKKASQSNGIEDENKDGGGDEKDAYDDDGTIMQVVVHRADRLKMDMVINHPLVKISLVDVNTGCYVVKSDRTRPTVSRYEVDHNHLDYIQPVMTHPFDYKTHHSLIPIWEDSILINDSFNYIIQPSINPVVFFELMDFIVPRHLPNLKDKQRHESGWYHIAWAFLVLKGSQEPGNWGRRVRLQLYQHPNQPMPHQKMRGQQELNRPDVYDWWSSKYRTPYPSTLHVTINKVKVSKDVQPSTRSLFPIQDELLIKNDGNVDVEPSSSSLSANEQTNKIIFSWSRLPGQPCKIPRDHHQTLNGGLLGCTAVRFSNKGRHLACAGHDNDGFPIFVYEVPSFIFLVRFLGHHGVIYDLCWDDADDQLLSASSDGCAKVWAIDKQTLLYTAYHPSFVYSAKFQPMRNQYFVTASYDRLIRIWLIKNSTNGEPADESYQPLTQVSRHQGFVNTLCFNGEGSTLFSADSIGQILVWRVCADDSNYSIEFEKELLISETKNIHISHLSIHPLNHRLLIHTKDNKLTIVDLRIESIMHTLTGALNVSTPVHSCFTPDGSLVIGGSEDGCAYVWSAESGKLLTTYTQLSYTNALCDLHFHPHDNYVVFCCHGYGQPIKIYKYNLSNENAIRSSQLVTSQQPSSSSSSSDVLEFKRDAGDILTSVKSTINALSFGNSLRKMAVQRKLDEIPIGRTYSNAAELLTGVLSSMPTHLVPASLFAQESKNSTVAGPVLTIVNEEGDRLKVQYKPPLHLKTSPSESATVTKDYTGQRSDELTLKRGDVIVVLLKDNDKWWFGQSTSTLNKGYFPSDHVTLPGGGTGGGITLKKTISKIEMSNSFAKKGSDNVRNNLNSDEKSEKKIEKKREHRETREGRDRSKMELDVLVNRAASVHSSIRKYLSSIEDGKKMGREEGRRGSQSILRKTMETVSDGEGEAVVRSERRNSVGGRRVSFNLDETVSLESTRTTTGGSVSKRRESNSSDTKTNLSLKSKFNDNDFPSTTTRKISTGDVTKTDSNYKPKLLNPILMRYINETSSSASIMKVTITEQLKLDSTNSNIESKSTSPVPLLVVNKPPMSRPSRARSLSLTPGRPLPALR